MSLLMQLIYHSTARAPFSSDQLAELLNQSRLKNARLNITGLLLYRNDGHFIQVLEGPPQDVLALFTSIKRDARHHSILSLKKFMDEREFPAWSMGFKEIRSEDGGGMEGFNTFMIAPSEPLTPQSSRARVLLELFKRGGGDTERHTA